MIDDVRDPDRLPLKSCQGQSVGVYSTSADGFDVITTRLAVVVAVDLANDLDP